jgi:hypothetical protein
MLNLAYPQPPLVPPRTYPVPPPSNLPYMLMGIARLFSWIAGGSVLLVLAYMVSFVFAYVCTS